MSGQDVMRQVGYFLRNSMLHESWKQARLPAEVAVNQAFRTTRTGRNFAGCCRVITLTGEQFQGSRD
jgi:hypothetical protein